MILNLEAPAAGTRKRWIGPAVLAAGLSMIVSDGTMVGVSLPAIIADLKLDLSDAQRVNSLYYVVFAALLLTAGRLGDRIGDGGIFHRVFQDGFHDTHQVALIGGEEWFAVDGEQGRVRTPATKPAGQPWRTRARAAGQSTSPTDRCHRRPHSGCCSQAHWQYSLPRQAFS
ncbi:MFS transporter [Pseudarthrobacter sp. O4]|uniref:MFS transporter n=1 Tax=Pseudarthrobacter sp. O4 TaxID=3418417 RepID=UPI003CEF34F9